MAEPSGIDVVGIGPGDPRYLTVRGRELIAAADCVAGFRSVLTVVAEHIRGEQLVLDYRTQADGLRTLAQRAAAGMRCVLCAHGDPSFPGSELLALARQTCGPLRLVPGVSSVQIACARAGLAMEDTLFITLHKRADLAGDREELRAAALAGRRHLIVLPRPWDVMPAALARDLVHAGVPSDRAAIVYERLTLEGEAEWRYRLGDLAQETQGFSDLSIVVIPRPGYTLR
ncbi:MAG: precorrin-6y C5,15-methyltransferase (decarboxylating) subunit CbiE [Chloroflexi bacterium]|nr:precorrin-6y C5,15-methyltransferase (decarboxylating) subunit CbiE [Chloroflexota bacterium]